MAFYHATDGDNWRDSDNWLSDAPISTWYGVTTDESGRVIELTLWFYDLRGTVPPELGNLIALTNLDLGYNQLRGPLPGLSQLTSLSSLNLSHNQLSGPVPNLNTLTNLTNLNLASNGLSGSIPNLNTLTNLTGLNISSNGLSGSVPNLSALTNLDAPRPRIQRLEWTRS